MRSSHLAALSAVVLLTACNQAEQAAAPPPPPAPAPAPVQLSDAEKAAILASLPAPYDTADLANGKAKFALCRSCHTITPGGANMTGPALYGVFGRKAGTHENFNYSDAVKAAGFTWDAEHLDGWLSEPRLFLPGTKMTFLGLKDEKDRVDLIAFLKIETGYKP